MLWKSHDSSINSPLGMASHSLILSSDRLFVAMYCTTPAWPGTQIRDTS